MRKLLQNKFVVSILAVVALLSIAANFFKLPGLPTFKAAAREFVPAAAPPIEAHYHVHGPAFTHLSNQPWRTMFPIDPKARDPFALPVLPAPVRSKIENPMDPTLPPEFILQGVSIEGNRAFAVINQTILTVGESIDGYRVERILPDQVSLSGTLGPLQVNLHRNGLSKKPPTANSPNSDLSPDRTRMPPGNKKQ